MSDKELLNDIYDILAQNEQLASQDIKDVITGLIDHVDNDNKTIVFTLPRGEVFTLKLELSSEKSPVSDNNLIDVKGL